MFYEFDECYVPGGAGGSGLSLNFSEYFVSLKRDTSQKEQEVLDCVGLSFL